MADFLLGAACLVLAITAIGLVRILYGPGAADRIMAAQILGTGGIAVLLLESAATRISAAADVAMVIALVSALGSAAFAKGVSGPETLEDP
jgi:multicomponent Na+:H+ antiporter subunit F